MGAFSLCDQGHLQLSFRKKSSEKRQRPLSVCNLLHWAEEAGCVLRRVLSHFGLRSQTWHRGPRPSWGAHSQAVPRLAIEEDTRANFAAQHAIVKLHTGNGGRDRGRGGDLFGPRYPTTSSRGRRRPGRRQPGSQLQEQRQRQQRRRLERRVVEPLNLLRRGVQALAVLQHGGGRP